MANTQPNHDLFTCLETNKQTKNTSEKGVKYVQSSQ